MFWSVFIRLSVNNLWLLMSILFGSIIVSEATTNQAYNWGATFCNAHFWILFAFTIVYSWIKYRFKMFREDEKTFSACRNAELEEFQNAEDLLNETTLVDGTDSECEKQDSGHETKEGESNDHS